MKGILLSAASFAPRVDLPAPRSPISDLRQVFFPLRRVDSRAPIERRLCFPCEPDLARVLGEEIHFLEAFRDGEAARPVADNHDVIGFLHDRLCETRNI